MSTPALAHFPSLLHDKPDVSRDAFGDLIRSEHVVSDRSEDRSRERFGVGTFAVFQHKLALEVKDEK